MGRGAKVRARGTRGATGLPRFLLACCAYWGLAIGAVSVWPRIEQFGIAVTLDTTTGLLRAFGQGVQRSGEVLGLGRARVAIVGDCSPHLAVLLFAGVVLAFPATWRARLFGLVLGSLALTAFNTVRVGSLLMLELHWPQAFDFAHVYLWQTGTLLAVIAAFLAWLSWVERAARPAVASEA